MWNGENAVSSVSTSLLEDVDASQWSQSIPFGFL